MIKKVVQEKTVQKVVLARKTTLTFPSVLNPLALLHLLYKKRKNSTIFLIQFSKEKAFLGATPERLYKREKNVVVVDALAGTFSKKNVLDPTTLFSHTKEKEEFLFVKTGIEQTLSPLCRKLEWEKEDTLLETPYLYHFHNQLRALLKKPLSDQTLLSMLHPTAAIGGFPQKEALHFLQNYEPFKRGYYAAPLGWIDSKKTELFIGIRSALIENNLLHLYAGAGIVKNSEPEKEWNELESKIYNFLG